MLVSTPFPNINLHLIFLMWGNKTGSGTTASVAFLIKITENNRFFSCSAKWLGV
jgi:hypothetical protein